MSTEIADASYFGLEQALPAALDRYLFPSFLMKVYFYDMFNENTAMY